MPDPLPDPRRLSEELALLEARFAERPVRLREVVGVLQQRAYVFLLLLFSLPFCQPIPLPGLSTPFGCGIALIGFRLALGRTPWLPRGLLDRTLPGAFFTRVLRGAHRVIGALERLLKPRWSRFIAPPPLRRLYGAMIGCAGVLLLLPLPIPFSNMIPGVTVLLLAAALMEEDGLCALAGTAAFAGMAAFFGALGAGGAAALGKAGAWLGGGS